MTNEPETPIDVEDSAEDSVDTEAATEATTAATELTDSSSAESAVIPQAKSGNVTTLVGIVLAALLVVASVVAAALFFTIHRADTKVDEAARQSVLKAAQDGTIALLSYSPDSLDRDFTTAKSHLTGDFLSYYTNFTQNVVTPAAQRKGVKTSAAVIQKAISEIRPDSAVVLVFLNQVTTSKDNPDGSYTTSAVKVSLQNHDGNWLISSFDPV